MELSYQNNSMENKKIAIDIVLLLPPEIIEKCVSVNSKLDNSKYVSFSDGYNPHITLGMGCVWKKDLENLKIEIDKLTLNIKKLYLTIPDFTGKSFFSFVIASSAELTELHKSIMDIMKKFSSYGDADFTMFNESEKVKEDSSLVKWISNFNTEHAFDLYDPHITLGKGEKPVFDFPINFEVSKVGLFHIGQRGTCKEKLVEFDLK